MASFRFRTKAAATAAAAFLLTTAATPAAGATTSLRINEVSDKGTSDGTCGGDDWIELHLPPSDEGGTTTTSASVNLEGFVLHDDNGPDDENAFKFDSSFSMDAGEFLLLCCGTADGSSTGPRFNIGGGDNITLLDAFGTEVSTTGALQELGDVDVTYAYFNDETGTGTAGGYSYTTSPTPGEENIPTSSSSATAEEVVVGDADSVRINEVSDKGTSDEFCGGNDWVELHLPTTGVETDLEAGYVLHDDNGPDDPDAFNFTSSSLPTTVMAPGDYLLLCCGSKDGSSAGPMFKIGGDDTVTLRDPDGRIVSTTGKMTDGGSKVVTYAYNDDASSSSYVYTGTPTPGSANVLSEPMSELDALYARLDAQNEMGMAFFDMDDGGLPVEGGLTPVVDLRMEMDPAVLAKMMDEQSYEVYAPFLNATVTNRDDPTGVLLELPHPGRIRPRGQSTLAFGTCLNLSVPFGIDWDHEEGTQTLFGAERTYLRNHLGDGSFVREWVSHRMLARFGLPHLRTRTVRFFLNGDYVGLYSLMEAPDQDYVFRRSFGDFDPDDYAIYKIKTMASALARCGEYDEATMARAEARVDEEATPPYAFERGPHRKKIPVLGVEEAGSNWLDSKCTWEFFPMIMAEMEDTALAYLRAGKDCGKMLVDEGLVDRDLGVKAVDDDMVGFINHNLGTNKCLDSECSNSNLVSEVDVDNWLRNFAVYAFSVNQDSPMGNGNNYLLADSGDGKGWKIFQYDHNNVMSDLGAFLCDQSCLTSTINWSIERPTCRSLDQNPLVGPLLTDPILRGRYMDLVREFVTTVAANATFREQIRRHLVAIEDDVLDDPWLPENGTFYKHELTEDGEWFLVSGNLTYVPLLPTIRARADDVLNQLDAHDRGTFPPRPIDEIHPGEPCVDWRSEVVGRDSPCHDGCYYDGCYRTDLLFSSVCDPMSGSCFMGTMDPMCANVSDFEGYDGIASFEGSDEPAFCMTNPLFGAAKTARCPPPPPEDSATTATRSGNGGASSDGCRRPYSLVMVVCAMVCAFVTLFVV